MPEDFSCYNERKELENETAKKKKKTKSQDPEKRWDFNKHLRPSVISTCWGLR